MTLSKPIQSPITTHVLDVAQGRPATGIAIVLERQEEGGQWRELSRGTTDAEGRANRFLPPGAPAATGIYRLHFDTVRYFDLLGIKTFYPVVTVVFEVQNSAEHYHVPLLLSPFGYSTYRGT